jgi:hypothetical protein
MQALITASKPTSSVTRINVDLLCRLKIPKQVLASSAPSGHMHNLRASIAMVLFDTSVSFSITT